MRRIFAITSSSLRMALQELWKNKLRTFLSLFGVTIGIFCIISVLATVNSLENNIQREIRSLGTNTIYIDKWEYAARGPEFAWWKYVNRPSPAYREVAEIKARTQTAGFAAFEINTKTSVEFAGNSLSNVIVYGVTEDFSMIQPVEIQTGRYITPSEFSSGAPSAVIGNDIAEKLFGTIERALNKEVTISGKRIAIAGIIKKQGNQLIGGWQLDKSVIMPYGNARKMMNEKRADPIILVKGKPGVNSKILKDELTSVMRSVHKLKPVEEDDFALNDVNDFSDALSNAFVSVNIGGWAIGALAFIVGIFGVANIMFVTVKERTSQIGLKKALGARNNVILSEFLVEAAFLCIIGGLIGLTLVFILTRIVTSMLHFPIYLSLSIILLALVICVVAGIIAGIVPAIQASRMNPVDAIRSK